MQNKDILFTAGCSWAEGGELGGHEFPHGNRDKDRASALVSKELNLVDVNIGASGHSHDSVIHDTLNYAVKNKNNSDKILMNIWLTSPERWLLYFQKTEIEFSVGRMAIESEVGNGRKTYLDGIFPNEHGKEWSKQEERAFGEFVKLWYSYFHDLRFYLNRYFKDIIMLHSTLEHLGYQHIFCNSFWSPNFTLGQPFMESRNIVGYEYDDFEYYHLMKKSVNKNNLLFGTIERTLLDYLWEKWNFEKSDYENYDTDKLSSFFDNETNHYSKTAPNSKNYFLCEGGHPSELGHEIIAENIIDKFRNQ